MVNTYLNNESRTDEELFKKFESDFTKAVNEESKEESWQNIEEVFGTLVQEIEEGQEWDKVVIPLRNHNPGFISVYNWRVF